MSVSCAIQQSPARRHTSELWQRLAFACRNPRSHLSHTKGCAREGGRTWRAGGADARGRSAGLPGRAGAWQLSVFPAGRMCCPGVVIDLCCHTLRSFALPTGADHAPPHSPPTTHPPPSTRAAPRRSPSDSITQSASIKRPRHPRRPGFDHRLDLRRSTPTSLTSPSCTGCCFLPLVFAIILYTASSTEREGRGMHEYQQLAPVTVLFVYAQHTSAYSGMHALQT